MIAATRSSANQSSASSMTTMSSCDDNEAVRILEKVAGRRDEAVDEPSLG